MSDKRYTIEELVEYSGYSPGMIYDLTCFGVLSKPVRGLDSGKPSGKGSYPSVVLLQLDRYKSLKLEGMKKADIITVMKQEAADVQVQQG